MDTGIRQDWLRAIVRECQAMVGHSLHRRPEPLSAILDDFVERLGKPQSRLETSLFRGFLIDLTLRWGGADHRSYHRVYGPRIDSCKFAPSEIAALAWKDNNEDPITLFAGWGQKYRRYFALAHPLHEAVELKSLIDQRFTQPILVSEFASQRNVSVRRLQMSFLQLTGQTILDYQTKRRVEVAVDMLRASDDKVAMIAHEVGWASRKNLNWALLKYTGKTPAMIRASSRSSKLA